jgi:hypothetical protein
MERLAVARGHGNGGAEGVGVRLPPSFSQDLTDALCSASRTARCCRRRAFAEPAAAAAAIPAIASNGSQRLSMYMEHPFVLIIKARQSWRPWNEGWTSVRTASVRRRTYAS